MVDECVGDASTTVPTFREVRFTEILEQQAPVYMAMGMTFDEYWNDDVEKAKYYLKAFKIKKKQQNQWLWLQGAYIYKVMQSVYPYFNAWAEVQPDPYMDFPIPLDTQEEKETENERAKRQMEEMQRYLEGQMVRQKEDSK